MHAYIVLKRVRESMVSYLKKNLVFCFSNPDKS